MLAFYWDRIRAAGRDLVTAASLLTTLPAVVAFFLLLFNEKWADALFSWQGFPGWYAFFIPALLILWALARGHYRRTVEREQRVEAVESALQSAIGPPGSQIGWAISDSTDVNAQGNLTQFISGEAALPPVPALGLAALRDRCKGLEQRIKNFLAEPTPEEPNPADDPQGWHEAHKAHMKRQEERLGDFRSRFNAELTFVGQELERRGLLKPHDAHLLIPRSTYQLQEVADRIGAEAFRLDAMIAQGAE